MENALRLNAGIDRPVDTIGAAVVVPVLKMLEPSRDDAVVAAGAGVVKKDVAAGCWGSANCV